jgi:hypothetical protein
LLVDILHGIVLAEVLLDALAQSEKQQDHEDDHNDADDVDDGVHELTLCVEYRIDWRAQRDSRHTNSYCTLPLWPMPGAMSFVFSLPSPIPLPYLLKLCIIQ